MKKIISLVLISALGGCTTHYRQFAAPEISGEPLLEIHNTQSPGDVRTVLTDGITTIKGSYYELNERLIARTQQAAITKQFGKFDKVIDLKILSVRCGGHFIPDCESTAEAKIGDKSFVLQSSNRNGHPWDSALDKTLDEISEKLMAHINQEGFDN